MLPLKEFIPVGNILIFLDRINVDIPQSTDLAFKFLHPLLHLHKIRQVRIPQFLRTDVGDLILLPHIVDLLLRGRFVILLLAFQTEYLLVKIRHML